MSAHAQVESPWLQVLGSGVLDLVNPTPQMIDFYTVGAVLARVPRFAGHTNGGTLSVAQHCNEGARAILRDGYGPYAAAAFLCHDMHEFAIGDMATPVRESLEAIAVEEADEPRAAEFVRWIIHEQKRRLDAAIYTAAGLPFPLGEEVERVVREYDLRMCRTERDARMSPAPKPWAAAVEAARPVEGCDLYPWSEGTVRAVFMETCRELLPCYNSVDSKRSV